jgi:pilus assembly protein Flp/PilA
MNTLLLKLHIKLHDLVGSQEGQDLVEFALVAALVAFGATACLRTLAIGVDSAFHGISSNLGSYDI